MNKYDVIISPILTEKSYDGIAEKKYTFKVASDATKTQIKVAVEDIFGVKVAKVNTVNVNGKKKRMGRSEGDFRLQESSCDVDRRQQDNRVL